MAFNPSLDGESWIVEEQGSEVLRTVEQNSVIERVAKRYNMRSDSYLIPRSHGTDDLDVVGKKAEYTFGETDIDKIALVARKFGKAYNITHEDLEDPELSILENHKIEFARMYAINLDNACLGVSGDADHASRPFTSVYRALQSSNSVTNYTGGSNVVTAGTGGVTYDDLSEVLGIMEESDFYDATSLKVISHPGLRRQLREIKDNEGRPIFVEHTNTGGGGAAATATLFGLPVEFSVGARLSNGMTKNPTGKKLLYVVNTDFLALGVRSGPETAYADEDSGVGFMSDSAVLKVRARRAFALTNENAAAVLEW
jgi:HK97 family phage major capsid protein